MGTIGAEYKVPRPGESQFVVMGLIPDGMTRRTGVSANQNAAASP